MTDTSKPLTVIGLDINSVKDVEARGMVEELEQKGWWFHICKASNLGNTSNEYIAHFVRYPNDSMSVYVTAQEKSISLAVRNAVLKANREEE